jgi:hypothetical protein
MSPLSPLRFRQLLRAVGFVGLAGMVACAGQSGTSAGVAVEAGAAPPVTRLAINLGGPVPVNADSRLEDVDFHATVNVPAGPWTGGEALRLSGVFGTATVSLDGKVIATVPPGPGSTEIDVAGLVPPGPHTIDIALTRANPPPPMVKAGDRRSTPLLVDGPQLLLRPKAHLQGLALPMDGAMVTPTARVNNAPEGATVRFVATLDGKVLAELGSGPVVDGMAKAPPVTWDLDTWQVGKPALYVIFGLLQTSAGGVLDAQGVRLGVHDVTLDDNGFVVGGASQKLIAWRASPHPFSLVEFDILTRTGANTFEFHGSPATDQQLGIFDETGIATLLTPRCEGTYQTVPQEERAGIVDANLPLIVDQSHRAAWDIVQHPTVVLWMSETTSLQALSKAIAEADPEGRPVVNVDLRMENLALGVEPRDLNFAGAFVGEEFWEGPMGAVEVAVNEFGAALKQGARGGVIEHVEDATRQVAWAPLLSAAGVPPLSFEGLRASSRVQVTGLNPGDVAWMEAPWMATTAEVARSANLTLGAWYAGDATLITGGTGGTGVTGAARQPVTLEALTWTAKGTTGTVPKVSATPAP